MSTTSPATPVRAGHDADKPSAIPLRGWREIFTRVRCEVDHDNVSVIAAGCAFYGLMALVPTLASLAAIYGLVANLADVQRHVAAFGSMVPREARELALSLLSDIVHRSPTALSFGAVSGIVLALWSASRGTSALLQAIAIAYHQPSKRGWLRDNAVSLLFTLVGILFAVVAIGLVALVPAALALVGLELPGVAVLSWLRWPVLFVSFCAALSILYRYALDREPPRWRWVSWGAAVATVLWLAGSVVFSAYVAKVANYGKTYGPLGAAVVLLMWLYLTAYVVVLGAEINAGIELQASPVDRRA